MQVAIEIILLSIKNAKNSLGSAGIQTQDLRSEYYSQVLLPLDHLDICQRIAIGRQAT